MRWSNESEGEETLCWGYEKGCSEETRLFVPHCDEPPEPWTQTMEAKHDMFWKQGDFGYVKQEVDSMLYLCHPQQSSGKKSLEKQIENVS